MKIFRRRKELKFRLHCTFFWLNISLGRFKIYHNDITKTIKRVEEVFIRLIFIRFSVFHVSYHKQKSKIISGIESEEIFTFHIVAVSMMQ